MGSAVEDHRLWGAPARPEFDAIARRAAEALGAPVGLMTLVGAQQQFHLAAHVTRAPAPFSCDRFVPLGYSFCQHVVALGRILAVEDAWIHPLVGGSPAVQEAGVTAYLGAPLREVADKPALGALCVVDFTVRRWSRRDARFIERLARVAGARLAREGHPEP